MRVCKPVDKNTQGKDYDRRIGVVMTDRGPDDVFVNQDAQCSYNLIAKALACGASGEFVVSYGDLH